MKIKKKQLLLIALLIIVFLIFLKTIDHPFLPPRKYSISFMKLGTVVSLVCYSDKSIDFSDLASRCSRKLDEAEAVFSAHKKDSELSRLNKTARTEHFPASISLEKVVNFSQIMWQRTNGAFDPTVYPLITLWGLSSFDASSEQKIPDNVAVKDLLPFLGMDKVNIHQNGFIRFENEKISLDLGGIAKGFILDELTAILQKEPHVFAGIVNIGGDLKAFQTRDNASSFKIGIRDPEKKDTLLGYVKIRNGCVVTSGGYERYKEYHDKKYIHIIDPQTGFPVENGVLSVTVIGYGAMKCDALATAFMVLGPEKSKKIMEKEKILFVVEREGKTDRLYLNGFELQAR